MFQSLMYLSLFEKAVFVSAAIGLSPITAAIVSVAWRVARDVWDAGISFVFPTVNLNMDTGLRHLLLTELYEESRFKYVFRAAPNFVGRYVIAEDRYRMVLATDRDSGVAVFWYRGGPVMFDYTTKFNNNFCPGIRYLRWTLNVGELMRRAEKRAAPVPSEPGGTGYRIVRISGSLGKKSDQHRGSSDNSPDVKPSPMSCLFEPIFMRPEELSETKPADDPFRRYAMSPEARKVCDDLEFWIKSMLWYLAKGVPWRRGYLLKGPGGTGKTSLIRANAQRWRMMVIVVDISTMNNHDLDETIQRLASYPPPYFVLIEDVDCTFEGRKNVAHKEGVTFNKLLELTNGIEELSGCVFWLTTNHPEKLDPALIRPERIDVQVELPPLDDAGRRLIAESILDDEADIEAVIEAGKGENGTYFKDRCVKLAVERYWGRA